MDFFTTTAEVFVLSLVGGSFLAIATQSIFDSIADQRVLTARFGAAARSVPKSLLINALAP